MAERKVDIDLTSSATAFKELTRVEKKARIATILDRGVVGDRLNVDLPNDRYGEWVPKDNVEIYRMQALGFEIDKEYAKARALHSDGTEGASVVGDVIFMTCHKEVKDLIEEIKRENYDRVNAPRRSKEEIDYENLVKKTNEIPVINSSMTSVDKDEIKNQLLQKS